jgi:hypothetical protein
MGAFELATPAERRAVSKRESRLDSPRGWMGASLGRDVMVARSASAVLLATYFTVYPDAFEFTLQIYLPPTTAASDKSLLPYMREGAAKMGGGRLPDDFLRFAVELSDGSQMLDQRIDFIRRRGEAPDLVLLSGGSAGSRWELRYLSAILPPPNDVAFVAEWPARDIPVSRSVLASEMFHEAASRAERLW